MAALPGSAFLMGSPDTEEGRFGRRPAAGGRDRGPVCHRQA